MMRGPPLSTRTDSLFPDSPLFRANLTRAFGGRGGAARGHRDAAEAGQDDERAVHERSPAARSIAPRPRSALILPRSGDPRPSLFQWAGAGAVASVGAADDSAMCSPASPIAPSAKPPRNCHRKSDFKIGRAHV